MNIWILIEYFEFILKVPVAWNIKVLSYKINKYRVPGAAAVHTAAPSILQQTEITDNTNTE